MKFTITLITENSIAMLSKISTIFTRRNINMDSIIATKMEKENTLYYTIVVSEKLDLIQKLVLQLEKQVEVIQAMYQQDKDVIYKEIRLLKITSSSEEKQRKLEHIISKNKAKLISNESDYILVEITGNKKDIDLFINDLKPFEIIEHIKSGQIALSNALATV